MIVNIFPVPLFPVRYLQHHIMTHSTRQYRYLLFLSHTQKWLKKTTLNLTSFSLSDQHITQRLLELLNRMFCQQLYCFFLHPKTAAWCPGSGGNYPSTALIYEINLKNGIWNSFLYLLSFFMESVWKFFTFLGHSHYFHFNCYSALFGQSEVTECDLLSTPYLRDS